MSRSSKVAPEHQQRIKVALKRQGFPSQKALADELGISRATIVRFFTGRPTDHSFFVEISEKLGLDWQTLVDIEEDLSIESKSSSFSDMPQEQVEAADSYNDSGVEYYLSDRLPQAVSDFSKALELDPNFAETHYNLGSVYEDLRDFDRARSEYRLAMLGGLAAAYNNLARLYILDKDYTAAVDLLFKGLKLASHIAEQYALHKNLGWARLEQGRYAEAKAELVTAIGLDGEQAPAYGLLALALEGLGETEDALVAWENCLRYASSYRSDEDTWIGLARQRLATSR